MTNSRALDAGTQNNIESRVACAQVPNPGQASIDRSGDPQSAQPLLNVAGLAAVLDAFATERDWAQFHSPKNLVMALTGEVGELTEIFQWMSEDASKGAAADPRTAQGVRDELADVMLYLVRLSSVLDVDLDAAVRDKLAANRLKYPVDKARGSSKKYNEI